MSEAYIKMNFQVPDSVDRAFSERLYTTSARGPYHSLNVRYLHAFLLFSQPFGKFTDLEAEAIWFICKRMTQCLLNLK